ncbi:MAG: hypothetical protein WCK58_10485, partial [Chloroflexota bacterium]
MFPSIPRRLPSRIAACAALLAITGLLAACGGSTAGASFDPASPCTEDVQQAGAYPALEALLPAALDGKAYTTLDSGRTCSSGALGSLGARGIKELRFAGATWRVSDSIGMTVAVFEAATLDPALIVDFYRSGARQAGKTAESSITDSTVGSAKAVRARGPCDDRERDAVRV